MRVVLISILCFTWHSSNIEAFCTKYENTGGGQVDFYDYHVAKVECLQISQSMDLTIENPSETEVLAISIKNSSFSTLPALFLSDFPEVRTLVLVNDHIRTIKLGAFDSLLDLRYLYLDGNEINTIPDHVFNTIHNLTLLSLKNNNLTVIDVELFNFLRSLTYLDLSGNPIKSLDNFDHASLMNLQTLFLNNTLIDQFTYDFTGDKKLNGLNISCSRVKTVDFSKLPDVRFADLSHNFIQNWTNPASETIKMRALNLGSNSISHLQESPFRGMYELTWLNLNNNSLSHIPIDSFRNLTGLVRLDLSHNKIRQFQIGTFSKMLNLEHLYVQHNEIFSIFEMNPLVSLVVLHLDYNRIDLNVQEVNLHFVNLSEISFTHNPWSCKKLVKVYHQLKRRGVRVLEGDSYDVENLHGIACDDIEPEISASPLPGREVEDRMSKFYDVDFFRTKFYKYFQEDYASSNFFSYLRNYKFAVANDNNASSQNESGKAEKFTSLAVNPGNGTGGSGVSIVIVILLAFLVFFVGCITYKLLIKDSLRNRHDAISMQEGLIL